MNDVRWLVSSYFEKMCSASGNSFIDTVKSAGLLAAVDEPPESWTDRDCVVVYGPKAFNIRYIKRQWIPGSYYRLDNLSYSGFSPHFGKHMLNDDYYILPFGELKRRGITQPMFIRPDKTTKVFTGMTVTPENFNYEINAIEQLTSVSETTLCVLATEKPIDKEYRFVIADRQIVGSTEYSWVKDFPKGIPIDPDCKTLAENVAKAAWQPDRVYVCDICKSGNETKILELNPFSSSGLYSCNLSEVVEGVSRAAWSEYIAEDLY